GFFMASGSPAGVVPLPAAPGEAADAGGHAKPKARMIGAAEALNAV
ncbi:MAG: hypothetical protein HY748_04990, partial [Elusimicrobia bacterium]|nr:hypothetical protein [Elusimicrobiota bacterium]